MCIFPYQRNIFRWICNDLKTFEYVKGRQVISNKTSETMKMILESVVSVGSGKKAYNYTIMYTWIKNIKSMNSQAF